MQRPMILFYVVVVYIFTSFIWWTILLKEKDNEIFREQTELIRYKLSEKHVPVEQTVEYRQLEKGHKMQQRMIMGESLVFMLLILLGAIQLRKSFLHEINFNKQQKNFLLSITHELRSPLASTKMTLQTLEKHQLSEEKRIQLLNNGLDDVERLQTLVENLLLATKIEDHSFRIAYEQCNLTEIVNTVIDKFKVTNQPGRKFETAIEPNVMMNGDKTGLQSVIMNLIENAQKYSPESSTVSVTLKTKENKIILTVTDEGAGIPLNERNNIFKKFYRVGSEETRRTKGTGLGLFIVHKLILLHKGKVSVRDNPQGGSVFEIELPQG